MNFNCLRPTYLSEVIKLFPQKTIIKSENAHVNELLRKRSHDISNDSILMIAYHCRNKTNRILVHF